MGIFSTQKKFFEAIAEGDERTVDAYLAGNKSWAVSKDKKTKDSAIHIAAKAGHSRIVTLLLNAGASFDTTGNGNRHALHYAADNGHMDVVRLLLAAGADKNLNTMDSSKMTPVLYAIRKSDVAALKTFLDTKKVDLNAGSRPPIYYAVEQKKADCVDLLLTAGADPNVRHTVTQRDYDDDYYSGGKSKTTKYSALQCACNADETAIAFMLLKAGAKTEPDEFPIHAAAANGNVPLVAELMRYGFDIKAVNSNKQTALHRALHANSGKVSVSVAEFLLSYGINRDALDKDGRTALSYAQQYAQTDIVRLLQDPLPLPAPMPELPEPQPKAEIPASPIMPAPVPAPAPMVPTVIANADGDSWMVTGKTVVHATMFPGINRRLMEIFNFETRERVAITENLALRTETMGPHESFDTISEDALRKAYGEFRKLGGQTDETQVFGSRLLKPKMKS